MTKAQNEVIRRLCKLEGKKSQVSVGNMREVVSILVKDTAKDLHRFNFPKMPEAFRYVRFFKAFRAEINKELKRLRNNK